MYVNQVGPLAECSYAVSTNPQFNTISYEEPAYSHFIPQKAIKGKRKRNLMQKFSTGKHAN